MTDNTVKKGWKDRNDARYIPNQDSMHVIMPYIMRRRCDNEAVLGETVDITNLSKYLEKKNASNPDFKYTLFHGIAAALAKTMILRPKMNWFYKAKRLYERDDIIVTFNVKKKFEDNSEEAIAKFYADRNGGSLLDQVHDYVREIVTKVRVMGENEGTTQKMNILQKLPRFVLAFIFWVLRVLDYFGIYPKSLMVDDPCYSSVFISNLGSIKMKADYHHLFEGGTISFFVVISEKKKEPVFAEDGSFEMRETVKLGLTIDERIADGFYFAKTLKLMRHLLQNPELLDLPAGAPVEFE